MQTTLKVEPLTPAAFAPYGEIIGARDDIPADFQSDSGKQEWLVDFHSGTPLITVVKTPYQGADFSRLESHSQVTQAFLPLGGAPAVIAVGRADAESPEPPQPGQVRAFLLDGSCGIRLGKGIWHSMDRMPLREADTFWAMISDHETQNDLYQRGEAMTLTRIVDYSTAFGTTFHISPDPA